MFVPSYYEFVNPGKILSGKYALENIASEFRLLGSSRVFVLSDAVLEKLGQVKILTDALTSGGVQVVDVFTDIPADSSIEVVNHIAQLYRAANADSIVALGGGSVLDTAKGLRMLISQGGSDIMKFVGAEVLPFARHIPFAAVPTTSGTGSEATAVAVIKDNERKVKMEFISQFLLPDLAVLDERFTLSMPARITAMTGLDALTHAIESYSCLQKNPISQSYARSAIMMIYESLLKCIETPHDKKARLAMANGSLLAGSAFSNSMVGIVHAIGHSLGGVCGLPHGLAMAILLPYCMKFNLEKCNEDYSEILTFLISPEELVQVKKEDRGRKCIEVVENFSKQAASAAGLSLRLSDNNVKAESFSEVASRAVNDGAIIVNPKAASKEDVLEILKSAF